MKVENLAYPWRKDLEKLTEAHIQVVEELMRRIDNLERRLSYLEPNVKEAQAQSSYGVSSSQVFVSPSPTASTIAKIAGARQK